MTTMSPIRKKIRRAHRESQRNVRLGPERDGLAIADAAGVEDEDVSIRRPTLDEVFLAETDAANARETEAAA